jgi:hypothetical protein
MQIAVVTITAILRSPDIPGRKSSANKAVLNEMKLKLVKLKARVNIVFSVLTV